MGGIATDLDAATSLPGLYAVGEVASSGVHGANRLASNSLSECLVMASQLSRLQPHGTMADSAQRSQQRPLEWAPPAALEGPCGEPITALRQWSWQAAGVERSGGRVELEAFISMLQSDRVCLWGECFQISERRRLARLKAEADEYAANPPWYRRAYNTVFGVGKPAAEQ